jgi:hypothetical protein
MSTQADQKFIAVADKEPGEMSVYKIDNGKNAIANLEQYKNQRNLTVTKSGFFVFSQLRLGPLL